MEVWVGKIALVTGASCGIGRAVAGELCKQGMKVVALARRSDKLQELEKEYKVRGTIKGIKCDVSKPEEIKAVVEWIEINWGPINVLINNAATTIKESLIDGTDDGMLQVFRTNVFGAITCSREVIATMRKHNVQLGHIININSIYGHYIPVVSNLAPYVTSKHALTAVTEILRNEIALERSPIKVTDISPGVVKTDLTDIPLFESVNKLQPEDISHCVNFILSTAPHVNISSMIVQPVGETMDVLERQKFIKANADNITI